MTSPADALVRIERNVRRDRVWTLAAAGAIAVAIALLFARDMRAPRRVDTAGVNSLLRAIYEARNGAAPSEDAAHTEYTGQYREWHRKVLYSLETSGEIR
jgi:hypothetical protein